MRSILKGYDPRMTLKLVETLNDRDNLYRLEKTTGVLSRIARMTDTIADIKSTIRLVTTDEFNKVVKSTRPLVRARKRLKTARLMYQMRNGDVAAKKYAIEFARFAKCLSSFPDKWRAFYAFELRSVTKSQRTIDGYKAHRARMERGRRAMHSIVDEYASVTDKVILAGLKTEHGRYVKAVKPRVKSMRTAIVKDAIAADGPTIRKRFDIDALSMWVEIKGTRKGE